MERQRRSIDDEFNFFTIDKFCLDEEWLRQPKLAFKYIRAYEDALNRLTDAKDELEIVKATIDLRIRVNPKKYKIPKTVKITEAVITNVLVRRKKYREALQVVREIEGKLATLRAAVKAIEHRKAAVENLVKLHGQNYFASPKPLDETSMKATNQIEKDSARKKIRTAGQVGKKRKGGTN